MKNKIVYHKGDVIEAALSNQYDMFVHVANCIGVMGDGVALQVRNRMKPLYYADKNFFIGFGEGRLGNCSYKFIGTTFCVNLYNQIVPDASSRQLHYGAMVSSILSALDQYDENKGLITGGKISICLPRMGCGLAGGDWVIVEEILEFISCGWDITFHVYDF